MPGTKAKRKKRQRAYLSTRLPKGPNGGVLVLLIQSVEHLGDPGDVVEVRPGYARNYLIPQGLATVVTEHHKRMVEKHRETLLAIQQARLASLRALAKQISEISVTLECKATDEGHLYGSVTGREIVAALRQRGITGVSEDNIRMESHIKEVGLHTVQVHLAPEIDAELKVWVVPPGGETAKQEEAQEQS